MRTRKQTRVGQRKLCCAPRWTRNAETADTRVIEREQTPCAKAVGLYCVVSEGERAMEYALPTGVWWERFHHLA